MQALSSLDKSADNQILAIMLADHDPTVVQCAYHILGDQANPSLNSRLEAILRAGDSIAALDFGNRMAALRYEERVNYFDVVDVCAEYLRAGTLEQSVAALITLTMHFGEGWGELKKRAYDAFQRNGVEQTWRQFAMHAGSLSEKHRGFIRSIFYSFDVNEKAQGVQLASLLTGAIEIWPDELELRAYRICLNIQQGDRDQATEQLATVEKQFEKRVSRTWLGPEFLKLGHLQDAVRNYRVATEREPTNDQAWRNLGWCAFLSGDLQGA